MTLRRTILESLANPSIDNRVGHGIHYFYQAIRATDQDVTPQQVLEACWELMADGLVFIDFTTQPSLDNAEWQLTHRGRRAVESGRDYEPEDPDGYLVLLEERLEGLDAAVKIYATEALRAYGAHCYLASSVMLGVASERAFQLLAEAFLNTLEGAEAEALRTVLANPRQTFIAKFREFRKRLEPRRHDLPVELSDNLALTFDGVLDLLRVARNDSGHPTGRYMDRQDAYVNLQLFGRFAERLEGLRRFFIGARSV